MATKSNRKDYTQKAILFLLVAFFVTASFVFFELLINQSIYPGEILQDDYTETSLFQEKEVRERLVRMSQAESRSIEHERGVYFYVDDGTNIHTNVTNPTLEGFRAIGKHFYAVVDGRYYAPVSPIQPHEYFSRLPGADYMLAFDDQFIESLKDEWNSVRRATHWFVIGITLSFLIAILCFLRLLYLISNNEDSILKKLDWIYLEFFVLSVIGMVFYMAYAFYNSLIPLANVDILNLIGTVILVFFSLLLFELLVLTIVSRLKREVLLQTSLIKRVLDAITIMFYSFTSQENRLTGTVARRTTILVAGLVILIALSYYSNRDSRIVWALSIAFGLLITWFVIANQRTFSTIDQSMSHSVQEMLSSEKTKMELITNVSHDLKTPLTSIISYVDLLKHEELNDTAKDYVNILEQKSDRLRQILQDVFDLSKATTGATDVHLETMDLRRLVEQTVFDMDAQIDDSGHYFKLSLPEYPVMIKGDGNKLYRVLQNILDNALKYTHPGTRIFLDVTAKDGQAIMELKNTSAYAMDFTSENVRRRFYRADLARTSEGSGLGLNIAESFTELSGGTFDIKLEGDLFKVIMTFPLTP